MNKFYLYKKIYAFMLLVVTLSAGNAYSDDGLGFANIKVKEANIRSGPSVKYPIKWVYKRKHWPVKITASFETWRKISDLYGDVGWVHVGMLSTKRYVVINGPVVKSANKKSVSDIQNIYRLPLSNSAILQKVQNGVTGELVECENSWCEIKINNIKGWIQESSIWGTK